MNYIIEHEGKQWTPNGRISVPDAAAHNAECEQTELRYWQTKPERMLAYITRNDRGMLLCSTWLGTSLGVVIAHSTFRNNLTGSRMTHIRVRGHNGATYHGTYGSDAAACRPTGRQSATPS